MVTPDSHVGDCYLDIDEQSVWCVVEWSLIGAGPLVFTLEHFLGAEERREVESQWLLPGPGGHYQLLTEMEVIAWMAK